MFVFPRNTAIPGNNTGTFLTAMLLCVKPEIRKTRRFLVIINTKHATIMLYHKKSAVHRVSCLPAFINTVKTYHMGSLVQTHQHDTHSGTPLAAYFLNTDAYHLVR